MRLLGRHSMSSVFRLLLDVTFYGGCLVGLALLVAGVYVALGNATDFNLSLSARFDLDPSTYQIQRDGEPVEARIQGATGSVAVRGGPTNAVLLLIGSLLVVLTLGLVGVYRMRRIFRRLVQGQPFLDENARNLRFIGVAVIVGELAWAGFQYLGERAVSNNLTSAEIAFSAAFAPRALVILAGFALLIVGEIFREGIKMRADLETARDIQTSLVAAEVSRYGAVSIHARMQPAAEIGGDYYDVIDLGGGRLAFVVADVAGKGLPAALLMTLLRGSLRSLLSAGLRGTTLLTTLNTHLVANTPDNRMITLFYGELDAATGGLTYVNAGHTPPYLYDADGCRPLGATAVVLGMIEDAPFPEASVELRAGSRLLLYTDGVTEAENGSGEQFGDSRLEAAIGGAARFSPAGMLDAIVKAVADFRGATRQSDDMTIMLVSRDAAA